MGLSGLPSLGLGKGGFPLLVVAGIPAAVLGVPVFASGVTVFAPGVPVAVPGVPVAVPGVSVTVPGVPVMVFANVVSATVAVMFIDKINVVCKIIF